MNLRVYHDLKNSPETDRIQQFKAIFFLYFIVGLSLQIAANTIILRKNPAQLEQTEFVFLYILWGMIIAVGSAIIHFSPFSFSYFGWRSWNNRGAYAEVLFLIACGVLVLATIKSIMLWRNMETVIFYWNELRLPLPLVYIFVVIAQEYMTRGFLLTSIEHLFTTPIGTPVAVVSSALIYSASHLYASLLLSALTFVFGIILGIVYVRTRTIYSVAVVHYIIGLVCLLLFGPLIYN